TRISVHLLVSSRHTPHWSGFLDQDLVAWTPSRIDASGKLRSQREKYWARSLHYKSHIQTFKLSEESLDNFQSVESSSSSDSVPTLTPSPASIWGITNFNFHRSSPHQSSHPPTTSLSIRRVRPRSTIPTTSAGMNNVTEQETNTLNQQQGPPTSGSNEEGNQQQATIASLTAQVTELQSSVSQIVTAMKALPIFQDPPAPPPAVPNTHAPPPHFQPNPYQPPTNSEFEYLARLEPLKIKDLWFSGDSDQLVSFLRHIRDFLRLRSTLFQSESRKVIWISRHFGWQPSEHKKRPSDTENWYNALLIENARQQGKVDAYGDLDGVEFQHKYLLSVTAFLDRLIFIFGDRFRKENAKRALA
ncbi:hypothetical protein MJO28_005024, partial [Puccinia striiformis f. sp. tritici]